MINEPVHGDRKLQEQGCGASLSPVSRSRTNGSRGTLLRVELGKRQTRSLFPLMETEDRALLDHRSVDVKLE